MTHSLFRVIALAAFLAAPGFLAAQTTNGAVTNAATTNKIGPRIQFNTEDYDFSKVLASEAVKYSFIATNTGDQTLVIDNARGTCSCTVVGGGTNHGVWTVLRVEPGQTGEIPVEIATANYAGQTITKAVIVSSNDRQRPVVNLQIHGTVWQPIEVTPAMATFNVVADTTTKTVQVVKIFNRMDTPLTVCDPVCNTNMFSVTLETNVPGKEFQLTIVASPPVSLPPPSGPSVIQGMISMKTSTPLRNPLVVSVFETVYPDVTIYPATVTLPAGPLPQAMTNHITIRGNSTNLTLSDVSASVPGIETSFVTIQTNRQYYLNAVFPKGFDLEVGQTVVLTLKTDNPRYPTVTVPVTAMRSFITSPPASVPPPVRTPILPDSIRGNTSPAGNSPKP